MKIFLKPLDMKANAKRTYDILYVDDEFLNLERFKYCFQNEFNIVLALSAEEALKILEETEFKLVIADLRMPEMDGTKFLEIITHKYPHTVRIALTAYSDTSTIIQAINRGGVYQYIIKPWKKHEVKGIILSAIEMYELKITNHNLISELNKSNEELKKYQNHLESLVKERTDKIVVLNEELIEINKKLSETNEKLIFEVKEKTEVQEALIDSEEKLRNYFEQSYDGIILVNDKGKIVLGNKKLIELTGKEPNQINNLQIWDLIYDFLPEPNKTKEYFNQIKEQLLKYCSGIKTMRPFTQDSKIILPNGNEKFLNIILFPINTKKEQFIGIIVKDITEKKIAEIELKNHKEFLEELVNKRTLELKQREEIFSNIFKYSPSFIIVSSYATNQILEVNDAFFAKTGYSIDKVKGKTTYNLKIIEKDHLLLLEKKLKKEGFYTNIEIELKTKSGQILNCLASGEIIKTGKEKLIIQVITDITQKKEAEKMLRLAQFSIEKNTTSVLWFNSDAELLYVNEKAYKILGYAREELMKKKVYEFTDGIDAEMWKGLKDNLIKKKSITREFYFIHKNNELIPVRISADYLKFDNQDYIFAFVSDITEQKIWEEALLASERNYREIFNATTDAIFVLNPETGKIIDINKAMLKMFECDAKNILYHKLENFSGKNKENKKYSLRPYIKASIEQGVQQFEWLAVKSNNQSFWTELTIKFIKISDENRILVVARDITERKNAEQSLLFKSRLENLVSEISTRFINLPPEMVDNSIKYALKEIGKFINVDLAYLIPYENITDHNLITHLWQNKTNIIDFIRVNKLKKEEIPWIAKQILHNDTICIPSINKMPEEASPDRELLKKLNIQSFIAIQIKYEGVPLGLLGFNSSKQNTTWDKDIIAMLRLTGHVFFNAIQRKKIVIALIKSEKNYREIFNATNEAIFVHNIENTKILDVNPAMLKMFGYSYEEALNTSLIDLSSNTAEFNSGKLVQLIQNASKKGSQIFEWKYKHKNGTLFWAEVSVKSALIGNTRRILSVVRNINDRKKTEFALQESETRYRMLAENASDVISLHNTEGKFLYISPSAKLLTDFETDELFGYSIFDFIHSQDIEPTKSYLKQILKGSLEGRSTELRFRAKNGEYIWFESLAKIIEDPIDPSNSRILSISRNINDRKQSEEALAQAADIFNNIQTGLHIYEMEEINNDRTLRMISANPASDELIGIPSNEIIGKTIDECFPKLREKGIPQKYAEVIRSKKPLEEQDIRYNDKRIVAEAFSIKAFPLQGNKVGIAFENITEKKQAEDELINTTKYLEAIVNASPSIIFVYNLDIGEISYISGKIQNLIGYNVDESISNNIFLSNCIHSNDRSTVKYFMTHYSDKDPGKANEIECRMLKKDGQSIWVNISRVIFEYKKKKPLKILGTITEVTQKKLAEQALRQSEERYRNLFEQAADGIMVGNSDGIIRNVNSSLLKMTGYEKEELVGKSMKSLFDNKVLKNKPIRFDLKNMSENVIVEREIKRKDGKLLYVEMNTKKLADGRLQSLFRDISKRKESEIALRESEEKYRLLFETSNDAIFMMRNDIFIDCNPATLKIFDTVREHIINKSPYYFSPDFQPDGKNSKDKALSYINRAFKGEVLIFEWQHSKYDKTPFDAEVTLKKIEMKNEKFVQAIVKDITERKLAEKALKQSEAKFRNIFNSSSDGIIILNEHYKIIEANEVFLNLTNYKKEELEKFEPFYFVLNNDRKALKNNIENLNSYTTIKSIEVNLVSNNKLITPVEIYSKLINYEGGKAVLSVVRDITERKLMDKQILDAIIKTEERERENFAKNLHDDLGPLLSSIKMYVNSIVTINEPEKQKYIVTQLNEIVAEAIQGTKDISNDLSPHVLYNYGLVAAIESFIKRIEEHIKINFISNLDTLRFSNEIETSMYRIIKELINNTIKHAKASYIEINLNYSTKKIILFYKDDGIGYSSDIMDKPYNTGMGISNIISRIRSLYGNYDFHIKTEKGVNVLIEIPAEFE